MSVDKQLKPSATVLECINGSHEPIYEWLVLMQSDTLSIFGGPKLIYGSLMLVYGSLELIYGDRESINGTLEYAYKIPSLLEGPSSLLNSLRRHFNILTSLFT
jgi:hypothetical protein